MSGSTPEALSQLVRIAETQNLAQPPEGSVALVVPLDFSLATDYELDLTQLSESGRLSLCQLAWVDLSATDATLSIQCGSNGQTIVVKGRTQGYYVLLCPNPAVVTFNSTAGIRLTVLLCNFDLDCVHWRNL